MAQVIQPETVRRCAACQARANCVFFNLPSEQVGALFAAMTRPVTRKKDEILFYEGEPAHGIYILRSGQLRLMATTVVGKLITTGLGEPGDILGAAALFAGSDFPVTVKAMTQCELEYMKRDDFLMFLEENANLQLKLLQRLSTDALKQTRYLALGRGEPAIRRLEYLLLDLSKTCGEPTANGGSVSLKWMFSGEEVAELVGVSRQWACKLMAQLKQNDIIKLKRGKVLVINKAALERDLD